MRFRLWHAAAALLPLCFAGAACAESITTRYGDVSGQHAEGRVEVSFANRVVATLDAESVSFARVTPKGPDEYVIVQGWLPGLHCHSEFVLLAIHPDKSVDLSPPFGQCMELKAADYLAHGVRITLSSPSVEGRPSRPETYAWAPGKPRKGMPYASAKKQLLAQGWRLVTDAGSSNRPFQEAPEVSCGSGYQAICSSTFQSGERELVVAVKPSRRGLVVESAAE